MNLDFQEFANLLGYPEIKINEWNSKIKEVKEARELKRLQAKEIASMLEITTEHYRKIEKGTQIPEKETLATICEILDLDFQEIANLLGYSEREINEITRKLIQEENLAKVVYHLVKLPKQDFELVADIVQQFANLTKKEKETIKFIVSYKK